MALSDPQTITVNAVAQTMPRVTSGPGQSSLYQKPDESYKFQVSHQAAKSGDTRSLMRYEQRAIAQDPISSENVYKTLGVQIVFIKPEYGFTQTQLEQLWAAIKTHIDNTMIGKIFGGES